MYYTVNSGEVAITTTDKTWLYLQAPTNKPIQIERVILSFSGTVVTHQPVICRLFHSNAAGSSTGLSTPTIYMRRNIGAGFTSLSTAQGGPATGSWTTTDPFSGLDTAFETFYVHPAGGRQVFDMDVVIPGGHYLGVAGHGANTGTNSSTTYILVSVDFVE